MDPKPCIVIHHGGNWRVAPEMSYVGGSISIYDDLQDDVNVSDVKQIVSALGYDNVVKKHFLDPTKDLNAGLRILSDHKSFDTLILYLREYGVVDIFYEHEYETGTSKGADIAFPSFRNGEQEMSFDIEYEQNEVLFGKSVHDNKDGSGNDGECNDNNNEEGSENDDEEDSDHDDEELADARKLIREEKLKQKEVDEEIDQLQRLANRNSLENLNGDSDYEFSSDLESPNESSDEDDCGYLVTPPSQSKPKRGKMSGRASSTPQETDFYIGQEFENAVHFRKAITNYCVNHGKDVRYFKNHRDKVGAKCKADGCTWKIWASWGGKKRTFIVKTLSGQHNCGRGKAVKKITAAWVAEHYHSKFKVNPYLKLQEIVDTIWLERGIEISIFTAHKARKKAQELILGEYMEQYGLLHRYAKEILRSNPENTVKFHLENNVFKRMYICFYALKMGFLSGCRPFISIDGCFLKGPYGGQLLVAVGRDGNNQMFPIAWSIVEVENYENWKWFLILLADDLKTTYGSGYTIMSDQQKGLIKAVTEVWAQAEHRCCARHVYCNFREVFGGGKEYRIAFWKIAKSTTENEFVERITYMNEISTKAGEDILKRNYKKWCRAFFTPQSQCDNVDNNMSEIFNAYILKSRHKPAITMLEDIRESLMERMHKKRDFIASKNVAICPRIQERLERSKFNARGWSAFWDGNFCFGVREGATQTKYVVNLSNRTCSCNVWHISGVPCHHAVAAIWKKGHQPEEYVADCYRRATYLKAYEHCLEPLNGPQEWPQSETEPILPPPLKKIKACRPTTKRRKQASEVANNTRMSRAGGSIRCRKCGGQGHNKRGCAAATQVESVTSLSETTSALPSPALSNLATKLQNNKRRHYTSPNTHSQTRSNSNCHTMSSVPQRVAIYTDYEGEQTIQSVSTLHENAPRLPSGTKTTNSSVIPWFRDAGGKHTITRQSLQDFSQKKKSRGSAHSNSNFAHKSHP